MTEQELNKLRAAVSVLPSGKKAELGRDMLFYAFGLMFMQESQVERLFMERVADRIELFNRNGEL